MSIEREKLKAIGRRVYEEFLRRIDDPKNTAKGDHWRNMSWHELYALSLSEDIEFIHTLRTGWEDPIWEAADKLVVDAMMIDKAESQVPKGE